jgi:acetylornithine deacetylase/succinyl-diaminopimelate desuccinylase-like protein
MEISMAKSFFSLIALAAIFASTQDCVADAANEDLARKILEELIAVNTAPSGGSDIRGAVTVIVDRLLEAGFSEDAISIVGKTERLPNLVIRYKSTRPAQKPLLLMAHLDVVEARPEDWTMEPFRMVEKEGYFYGRGASDNKAGAAILVANLIRLKQEKFESNRDLIVMLTADEESDGEGAQLLVNDHRPLIDAEFALNTDGGLVLLKDDEPRAFVMQTSEKIYASFMLEALDPGGHSSRPRGDSAISRLARMLADLYEYRFPIDLNETTAAFFDTWKEMAPPNEGVLIEGILAGSEDPEFVSRLDDSPYYNALARTTCVATQISGGHAENALPQSATAVVNCRVLPQSSGAVAQALLESLAAPYSVTVTPMAEARPSPPSPLQAKVVDPVTSVAREIWPGIPIIPEMSTGATDGLFVRNAGIPVYAVSANADNPDDLRAHGQDERIRVQSFNDATEYWYRLVRTLSSP